ncbi:hypothetical protein F5887DRAFT_1164477 [Amanita rubescens]|nr:hypothetical protein F5887DRAFT_1164477 [Amanita rubescens]
MHRHRPGQPLNRSRGSFPSHIPPRGRGSGASGSDASFGADSLDAHIAMDTEGDDHPPSTRQPSQAGSTHSDGFPEAPDRFGFIHEACADFRTAIDGIHAIDLPRDVHESLGQVLAPFALALGIESFVVGGRRVTVTRAAGTVVEDRPPEVISTPAPIPPATSEPPPPTGTAFPVPPITTDPAYIRINKKRLLGRPPPPPPARRSYASVAGKGPAAPPIQPPPHGPSKQTANIKSCTRQGTKASALVLRFRPSPTGAVIPPLSDVQRILAGSSPPPAHVGYTLRGDLLVRFPQAIGPELKKEVISLLSTLHAGGVQLLSRDTTSLIKFMHVPTHRLNGGATTSDWLHATVSSHPRWKGVHFVQQAHFVIPSGKTIGYTATVVVEVADDRASSVARRLLQTDVNFDGIPCRARPWVLRKASRQCGICLRWGHTSHVCSSRLPWCALCANCHSTAVHEQAVQQDVTMEDIKCINCRGPHPAISRDCPFFISRFDDKALAALQAKRLKQVRQARDQRHQTKQTARVAARYEGLGLD